MLSLCVTLDSDGSSASAAAAPAAQASTMAQRKRTASRPAAAKKVPTKAIVVYRGAAPLRPAERKVGFVADRYGPAASGLAPGDSRIPRGLHGSATSAAGSSPTSARRRTCGQRLNSYFADFASLHPRTQTMLTTAAGVEWTVVGTEVEALQLEYSWIKEFDPRFNVTLPGRQELPVPRGHHGRGVPAGAW